MSIKILLCLSHLLIAGNLFASPSVIDSTAYTLWHKAENVMLSDNGQWVMYQYHYLNNDARNVENRERFYCWNNRTNQTIVLDSLSYPSFIGEGDWISYLEGRKSHQYQTMFMNLRTHKRVPWTQAAAPTFEKEAPIVSCTNEKQALVFYNLSTQQQTEYPQVRQYQLLDRGTKILYIKETDDARLLCYGNLHQPKRHRILFKDKDKGLRGLKYQQKQGQFTISYKQNGNRYERFYDFDLSGQTTLLADTRTWNLPAEIYERISYIEKIGKGSVWEIQLSNRLDDSLQEEEEAVRDSSFSLQLWSWNDPMLQSEQEVRGYHEEMKEPEKYIYHSREGHLQKIVSAKFSTYQPVDQPKYALIRDESAFKQTQNWRHVTRSDLSILNLETGQTYLFSQQQIQSPFWSKNGDYVIFYDDASKEWKRLDPETKEIKSLTAAIPYPIYNEAYDMPHAAPPYGFAGWSEDGKKAYLYDQFDIWEINLEQPEQPACFTKGIGRKEGMILRFPIINYEEEITVPSKGTILLHLKDWKTKATGLGHISASGQLERDLYGDFTFEIPAASKDKRFWLLDRQSFKEGRNIWIYDTQSHHCRQVTQANPHHNGYAWGSVKLVQWTNFAGKVNQGLLYLPADYDKNKKYPAIVNYYETHADEKHLYYMPDWSSGMLDIPTYLSQGYIIFRPDVYFKVGSPAQSTYDSVVSGVEYLIKEGTVTPGCIGVMGHSWSGCTGASLITMTDIFRCAVLGSPVVNMTESYSALRHGTGNTHMFMYEDWQCRMGKSLWEAPEAYIRSSAIFRADRIHTPVLIMHNDRDEAVAYHDGRNFYLAMRRLQKPAWLLNYEGEGHFILNPSAQRDYSRRMLQFFNHYLKKDALPRWMMEGINVNEKNRDRKLDLIK